MLVMLSANIKLESHYVMDRNPLVFLISALMPIINYERRMQIVGITAYWFTVLLKCIWTWKKSYFQLFDLDEFLQEASML